MLSATAHHIGPLLFLYLMFFFFLKEGSPEIFSEDSQPKYIVKRTLSLYSLLVHMR